ncbi:uncharacterized protein LOC124135666 [Haliotis rufescens]|uniref:uncharacterized protein LOC124135666 n=1 Tax=Haliotis rufescens TaxID=6454 RepID=UPI00201EDA34|nr:uncharacterized protein LOC124135666 [Haliotis rufescens]
MPVDKLLSVSESEGYNSEVAECSAPTESTVSLDAVPNFVTIKPTPIRSQPPFQSDFSKEDTQQARKHELRVQMMAALAQVEALRSDIQEARVCYRCLDLNNLHLKTQVGQLSDQKDSLREQVQRLGKEVDMLKGKGQRVHSGQDERDLLAQRSGVIQTTCFDQTGQAQNIMMSHGQDKLLPRRQLELSQSNLPSRKDLSSSATHLIEHRNTEQNVQKSKSFFNGLSQMFRRHRY